MGFKLMNLLHLLFYLHLVVTYSSENFRSSSEIGDFDPCYDSITRKAQRCIPNFENVAFKKKAIASSTCGSPPMKYCLQSNINSKYSLPATKCHICDSSQTLLVHNQEYLNDLEKNNQTCWISAPVYEPSQNSNISVTISFGKKHELTYVSLQFCTQLKPDSFVILKSEDYGKSWIPFQFYSSDCKKVYNKPLKAKITQANEQEAICVDDHLKSSLFNLNKIGFSTLDGRPSFYDFETSSILQDWVTATDIKIVFTRLLSPSIYNNFKHFSNNYPTKKLNSRQSRSELINQIHNLGYYYASVSEIAIGGRCKCNGHASRCIKNREGQLQCDCKHNTAGLECEKCLPFYYDRPWSRATPRDANECIACNCNNHSNKCRFNKELYLLSGKKSGGVCLNCKHNTAGRFCHYCAEGYFRNFAYLISHRQACQECNCHMIGSSGKNCNQNTGQCPCKEGVTGLRCDRCKKGYKQTNSALVPCIKTTKKTTTTTITPKTPENSVPNMKKKNVNFGYSFVSYNNIQNSDDFDSNKCDLCKSQSRKIGLKDFCRNDLALIIHVNQTNEANNYETTYFESKYNFFNSMNYYSKYSSKIDKILKNENDHTTNISNIFVENQEISLWFKKKDLTCNCPKIRENRKYLLVTKLYKFINHNPEKSFLSDNQNLSYSKNETKILHIIPSISIGLFVDKHTIILEWRSDYAKRVKRILNRNCN